MINLNKIKTIFDRNTEKEIKKRAELNISELFALIKQDIDKNKLTFNENEHRIKLYSTEKNESIYIRYPGKESNNEKQDYKKHPEKIRPYDFRPELVNSSGKYIDNLSFGDIWKQLEKLKKDQKTFISLLFFRFSIFYDSTQLMSQDVNIEKMNGEIINTLTIKWYPIKLSNQVLKILKNFPTLENGFSVEAILYYYDLICQNEDCKYYYRNCIAWPKFNISKKKPAWDGKIGRRNTYSSHIGVLGAIEGKIGVAEVCWRLTQAKGICKLSDEEFEKICGGFLKIIPKNKKK